jgi:hypothetical protein
MPWKITKNHVGTRLAESFTWDDAEHLEKAVNRFRMYDDDGELYYEGIATFDSSFQPLDDYGMPNAGCTEIRYYERGAWRTL